MVHLAYGTAESLFDRCWLPALDPTVGRGKARCVVFDRSPVALPPGTILFR